MTSTYWLCQNEFAILKTISYPIMPNFISQVLPNIDICDIGPTLRFSNLKFSLMFQKSFERPFAHSSIWGVFVSCFWVSGRIVNVCVTKWEILLHTYILAKKEKKYFINLEYQWQAIKFKSQAEQKRNLVYTLRVYIAQKLKFLQHFHKKTTHYQ